MKKKAIAELLAGASELGAYLRGDRQMAVRIDRLEPDSVAVVRTRPGLSQAKFARALGISVATLQNGEQGRRRPTGPARVLLRIAAKHPEAVA